MKYCRLVSLSVILLLGATMATQASAQAGSFTLRSTAFENDTAIPLRHSAYGENVSPRLL